MGVRLTVKVKSEAGAANRAQVVTLDEEVINLGRDQSCQVVLAQMAVSRNHARISRDGTLFFLEDLGSSYGTHINGERLPKGEKRLLRNGDVIAIAQFDVVFDRVADVSEDASGKTQFLSRRAVKNVMKGIGSRESPYLRMMNGPREGQHIELNEGQECVFGRDEASADVVLNDDLVSRRHAKIRRDWAGVTLEDLQSRNGVKVNHKRIKRATLKDRDELEIGGVRLLFVDPAEPHDEPLVMPSEPRDAPVSPPPQDPPPPPPAVEARAPEPAPPEPEPEPQPEPEPDPAPDLDPEDQSSEEPPPEEDEALLAEAPGKLFDLSNQRTLIALGIGGALVLLSLVFLLMLISGC
jgi:pSer/pThr/pTyr-binding forkhead associated (FHA) protein